MHVLALGWTGVIVALLISVTLADSNSWHKYGIGRITRVFSDAETNTRFIAASEKGVLAKLHVSNLTTGKMCFCIQSSAIF